MLNPLDVAVKSLFLAQTTNVWGLRSWRWLCQKLVVLPSWASIVLMDNTAWKGYEESGKSWKHPNDQIDIQSDYLESTWFSTLSISKILVHRPWQLCRSTSSLLPRQILTCPLLWALILGRHLNISSNSPKYFLPHIRFVTLIVDWVGVFYRGGRFVVLAKLTWIPLPKVQKAESPTPSFDEVFFVDVSKLAVLGAWEKSWCL